MSTFNDTIRRQLGFDLISWNTPEHRAAANLSRPHPCKPPQVMDGPDTVPAATLAGRVIAPGSQ